MESEDETFSMASQFYHRPILIPHHPHPVKSPRVILLDVLFVIMIFVINVLVKLSYIKYYFMMKIE